MKWAVINSVFTRMDSKGFSQPSDLDDKKKTRVERSRDRDGEEGRRRDWMSLFSTTHPLLPILIHVCFYRLHDTINEEIVDQKGNPLVISIVSRSLPFSE
jgi:hypothetical protein